MVNLKQYARLQDRNNTNCRVEPLSTTLDDLQNHFNYYKPFQLQLLERTHTLALILSLVHRYRFKKNMFILDNNIRIPIDTGH